MAAPGRLPLGSLVNRDGVLFRVWAPRAERIEVLIESSGEAFLLDPTGNGYYERFVSGITDGAHYRYRVDGEPLFPDPASRFQPVDVHGPSMVVDPNRFTWSDADWQGIPQRDLVFYELHVGTFSPEGTYEGVRRRLPYLKDLGINAIELMPLADFPGRWNWGYDHASLYAPSRAYGTPDELRALVDEAHGMGMAVFLDVIYNHLGPDGAYVAALAPMFTERHKTPWGQAMNLDDTDAEGVRHLFIDNALHWLQEYHFDGLRLDATHALKDDSDTHFLADLSAAVDGLAGGPPRILIAEDFRNLNTLILPREDGGYGLDAVWVDDFHHQVRNITAGDVDGYYASYEGTTAADLVRTLRRGWFFEGQHDVALGEPRGTDPSGIQPIQCVHFIQNHDQIGNRPNGNRLTDDVPMPVYRAASALLLFTPGLPMLFMGQEWAATAPFLFFSDHNPELGKLVTEGRKEEFKHFTSFQGDVPDPQDPATFERSRLDWSEIERPPHRQVLALYRQLLALRRRFDGPLEAEVHGTHGLALRRGRYHLLVALRPGLSLPLPPETRVLWHTEVPEFSDAPRPPVVEGATVRFPEAAAVVLEQR